MTPTVDHIDNTIPTDYIFGPLEKMYKSPIFNGYSLSNHCLPPTSRGVTDVSAIQTLMGGAPIKIENTLNSPDFQTQVSGGKSFWLKNGR